MRSASSQACFPKLDLIDLLQKYPKVLTLEPQDIRDNAAKVGARVCEKVRCLLQAMLLLTHLDGFNPDCVFGRLFQTGPLAL